MFLRNDLYRIIASFLVGIFTGMLLLALLYLLFTLMTIKRFQKKSKPKFQLMEKRELTTLIKIYQEEYMQKQAETTKRFDLLVKLNKQLITDIAAKFAPKSTKPYFELTVNEIVLLLGYISKRLDDLLKQRLVKRFRGLTIKQIMDLRAIENKTRNSNLAKGIKLSGMDKFIKAFKILNPVHWIKTVLVEPIINKIILEITLNVIAIIAEETYLVYSKKAFDNTSVLVNNITLEEIYQAVNQELGDEPNV